MRQCFRNFSLAIRLFRTSPRIRHSVFQGESCCPSVSSQVNCTDVKRRRNFIRAELITIVVSHVGIFACPLNW